MKKLKSLAVWVMLFVSLSMFAQDDTFGKDILKLQEVSGASATAEMVYKQLTNQMKQQVQMQNAPQAVWQALHDSVFITQMDELYQQLIPIYKKYYTHDEVEELIAFYESPIGKKMSTNSPMIAQESMMISQTWAMGLMQKMNDFMVAKGYGIKSIQ